MRGGRGDRRHGRQKEPLVLWEPHCATLRFGELHHEVPPKVEYSLTDFGRSLMTALEPLGEWGEHHKARIEAIPRQG